MKNFIITTILTAAAALAAACGGAGNTTVTTNVNSASGNANANRSTMNSVGNSMGNAANSVSNSVSNAASSMMTDTPEAFMKHAAEGGMEEVELGKAASTRAQNPEVKKFAQMMVADHGKANEELMALAKKKNITLPTDPGSKKADVDKMNGLKGADFDREYVDMMVDDHEADVTDFERQANNGSDPDVKAFAAKTLPVLKKHLEAIKAIQAKLNQ
jgi:putative membrane protein